MPVYANDHWKIGSLGREENEEGEMSWILSFSRPLNCFMAFSEGTNERTVCVRNNLER